MEYIKCLSTLGRNLPTLMLALGGLGMAAAATAASVPGTEKEATVTLAFERSTNVSHRLTSESGLTAGVINANTVVARGALSAPEGETTKAYSLRFLNGTPIDSLGYQYLSTFPSTSNPEDKIELIIRAGTGTSLTNPTQTHSKLTPDVAGMDAAYTINTYKEQTIRPGKYQLILEAGVWTD